MQLTPDKTRHGGRPSARRNAGRALTLATVVALTSVVMVRPVSADFEAGWAAYQRGDFAAAIAAWRPLAEHGMARAQFNLGVLFDEGKGVERDLARAMAWWRKAAEQNMTEAQHNLASLYIAGEEVPQDYARALVWLNKAAAQGLARSQYTLGKFHAYGLGIDKDEREAATWFFKAGRQGYARAQYNLGKMYRDGRGELPKSLTEAAKWFELAARQGYTKAQLHLATRYARGEGVAQDRVMALAWLTLAAEQEMQRAIDNRKALMLQLSADEIGKARTLADALRVEIGK